MNSSKDQKQGKSSWIVAGLIASAAAGVVYLYGKDKKKTQRRLRGWMLKAKGEIMEQIATAETLTRKEYERLVDAAVDKYKKEKQTAQDEIEAVRRRLKDRWNDIAEEVESHVTKVQESGSHVMKSAVSEAITGAAKELASQKDNEDMDALELIKKVAASGAENAATEIKAVVTRSDQTTVPEESDE